jgi:hypothetical protein
MITRRTFAQALILAASSPFAPRHARGGLVTTDEIGDQVQTVARGQVPDFARRDDLARLYRFAVEHGDELKYIPCFCGCVRFGHRSNRDCYIKSANADGAITFTSHAAT